MLVLFLYDIFSHRSNLHSISSHYMYLVIDGYERVMGREGSSRSLPVNQQRLLLAVNEMLLDLGDIVRHVIDHVHVKVIRGRVEHLGEGLSGQEGHTAAVDPGVVSGGRHRLEVVLALLTGDMRARQLAVVNHDVVALHRFLHRNQRVCEGALRDIIT